MAFMDGALLHKGGQRCRLGYRAARRLRLRGFIRVRRSNLRRAKPQGGAVDA